MADFAEKVGGGDAGDWWSRTYELLADMKARGVLLPTDEKFLDSARGKLRQAESTGGEDSSAQSSRRITTYAEPSRPHPAADGARAAQLNMEYIAARKAWEALPWLKRIRTPKPEPPSGI
jgi:hypothetical protein